MGPDRALRLAMAANQIVAADLDERWGDAVTACVVPQTSQPVNAAGIIAWL